MAPLDNNPLPRPYSLVGLPMAACFTLLLNVVAATVTAEEAQWIWSPEHAKDQVPQVSCYFRKVFTTENPMRVQATIAADDEYELYVNGRRVGSGRSSRE